MKTLLIALEDGETKDCYEEYGLILTSLDVGTPSLSTVTVDVPGRNGTLDLTERLYGVPSVYGNRTLSIEFQTTEKLSGRTRSALYKTLVSAWHGKMAYLSVSDDTECCYYGRLSVGSFTLSGNLWEISVEADCKPYKYTSAHKLTSEI